MMLNQLKLISHPSKEKELDAKVNSMLEAMKNFDKDKAIKEVEQEELEKLEEEWKD